MMTPIHVLCSNFTKIVHREVGETMRCFGDKKVRKMRFFGVILRRFDGGRQKLQENVPHTSPCKTSSQSVPICCCYGIPET